MILVIKTLYNKSADIAMSRSKTYTSLVSKTPIDLITVRT